MWGIELRNDNDGTQEYTRSTPGFVVTVVREKIKTDYSG